MPKDSALFLHRIQRKLIYIYKSNLVFHASTEKLQYVSLKYDKLTRENLTYSANVGAVGVYVVLITNKQYSQKFKFGMRVNKFLNFVSECKLTSWCFHDKLSDIVSALRSSICFFFVTQYEHLFRVHHKPFYKMF